MKDKLRFFGKAKKGKKQIHKRDINDCVNSETPYPKRTQPMRQTPLRIPQYLVKNLLTK